jgi:hypothetical protein
MDLNGKSLCRRFKVADVLLGRASNPFGDSRMLGIRGLASPGYGISLHR